MRYLIAILCPPLAVLMCFRPLQFLCNLVLYVLAWLGLLVFGFGILIYFLALLHAILVVSRSIADRRTDRVVGAIVSEWGR